MTSWGLGQLVLRTQAIFRFRSAKGCRQGGTVCEGSYMNSLENGSLMQPGSRFCQNWSQVSEVIQAGDAPVLQPGEARMLRLVVEILSYLIIIYLRTER